MTVSLSPSAKANAAQYLKDLGIPFSAQEIEKIFRGELVRCSIDTLTERELAAAFGILYPKKPEEMESMFLENLGKEDSDESIQQLVNSNEDLTLDFSSLKLLPAASAKAMVKQYVDPKSYGDLNLSAAESKLVHALNHKTATVEQVESTLRKVLEQRLDEYQQKGVEGIGSYQRGRSTFESGKELLERCQKLELLLKLAPEFAKYIEEYPNSKPTTGEVKESFCWMNFKIDEKSTFSIVHKIFYKQGDLFVIFHRHFYVSRGHNNVQAVGGGISVDEKAVILFFSSRTSTDQVAGFGGSAKRALGSRIMGDKLAKNLSAMVKANSQ
jgi:hypothetical protein